MLGFKFIKAQPTTYLMAFKQGRAVREGAGLSLIYYAPTTNLVAVPIGSREAPFGVLGPVRRERGERRPGPSQREGREVPGDAGGEEAPGCA